MSCRGGIVKQVPRRDPMNHPEYPPQTTKTRQKECKSRLVNEICGKAFSAPKPPPKQGGRQNEPTKSRSVNEIGGTSSNPTKRRKRLATDSTTQPKRKRLFQEAANTSTQPNPSQHDDEAVNFGTHCSFSQPPPLPLHNEVENHGQRSASRKSLEQPCASEDRCSQQSNRTLFGNRRVSPDLSRQREPQNSEPENHRNQQSASASRIASVQRNSQRSPNQRRPTCNLREASNSPLNAESAPPPIKIPRGHTTLPKLALRDTSDDKNKLPVEVVKDSLVGAFSLECILAIGMWVRQSENFPLSIRLFRNMPEEKILRVSKLVRDYYVLLPDDENAEKAIRKQMRLAYVRYRAELARHYRSFDTHEEALQHPSPRIRSVDDWAKLCEFFNEKEFKEASEKARIARKAQALNHTNGTESFARLAHQRASKKLPVDPLSMFMETHKPSKLGKVCQEWTAEMEKMSKQVQNGEASYTPEEIYAMVVDPKRYGCKRARKTKAASHFSLYEKNEAQLSGLQNQLDAEKRKVAKQDKQILKLKRRERKLIDSVNELLKKIGSKPILEEDDSEDDTQNECENEVADGADGQEDRVLEDEYDNLQEDGERDHLLDGCADIDAEGDDDDGFQNVDHEDGLSGEEEEEEYY